MRVKTLILTALLMYGNATAQNTNCKVEKGIFYSVGHLPLVMYQDKELTKRAPKMTLITDNGSVEVEYFRFTNPYVCKEGKKRIVHHKLSTKEAVSYEQEVLFFDYDMLASTPGLYSQDRLRQELEEKRRKKSTAYNRLLPDEQKTLDKEIKDLEKIIRR